jgi:putative membrane-bound dehydrogenase-like protein
MLIRRNISALLCFCAALPGLVTNGDEFPGPRNTQEETVPFLKPSEALARVRVPDGYRASLFAAEPDVQQPIGFNIDDRGRLWIAENYTYAEHPTGFDLKQRDRLVILEDADGDGKAEKRTVFHDNLQLLSSVETGFGGVWVLASPNLLFIPDRNGDDVPDGPPEVVLDGWDTSATRHNIVNGLKWGPDGWLYGRNGILATSKIGVPGTPPEERENFNCGIWRYHPTQKRFEVVARGTTNPWGHDWDENGELFFINTVIGHMWHVVPGAHFRRMYGNDPNPNSYELIEQTADHFHWDTREIWSDIRKLGVTKTTDAAGGGHAHSGFIIYQGDNWPKEQQGLAYTINYHGRRLNADAIAREGATYVGKHRPDFCFFDDVWFRGIDLMYGPDGGVYVADWSDIGECHDNDGIHRSSGRIFKITHDGKKSDEKRVGDVEKLTNEQVAELVFHPNEWYSRRARLELQERHAKGDDLSAISGALYKRYANEKSVRNRLRAVWAINLATGFQPDQLAATLVDSNENVRVQAVRMLADGASVKSSDAQILAQAAAAEQSGLVLTHIAGALQKMAPADRWKVASELAKKDKFADDRVFPLMVWYGIEGAIPGDTDQAVKLLAQSKIKKIDEFVARRITGEMIQQPGGMETLVAGLADGSLAGKADSITAGMHAALQGWRKAPEPKSWKAAVAATEKQGNSDVMARVRDISVVFGDGRAADELKAIVADGGKSTPVRRGAIESLATSAQIDGVADLFRPLLKDRDLCDAAVRGYAKINPPDLDKALLEAYGYMTVPAKDAAIEALSARAKTAASLLQAVRDGRVPKDHVPAFAMRQMQLLGDAKLTEQIYELFPSARRVDADRLKLAESLRTKLTSERIEKADLLAGKAIFVKNCAKCHKLFGEGQNIGPDLTGAQRTNLNYWLENILDPSAVVADKFRMSIVALNDGRVLNGVILRETDRVIELQTPNEKVELDRTTVEEVTPSTLSLMPENQLAPMSDNEVRDLFGYLMTPVPPVEAASK